MNTTMKKLLVAVLFLGISAVEKVHAVGYYSFSSTAVLVTMGNDMELLSIEVSSAPTKGETYIVVYDSYPLNVPNGTSSTNTPVALVGAEGELRTKWPATQFITPPMVLISTGSNAVAPNYTQKWSFETNNGEGRSIRDGLVIMKLGTDIGTVVTVTYRKRVDVWRR